jgi:SAM-dependent methyltransferase
VLARGEGLPFADGGFDAVMALHTVHHWDDPAAGLGELRRVAPRVVVLAGDASVIDRLWLTAEYFPGLAFGARGDLQPRAIAERLGGRVEVRPLRVPVDCVDGFPEAFVARPEAYLDPDVRRNMSSFRLLAASQLAAGVARLRCDLASGLGRPPRPSAPPAPPGLRASHRHIRPGAGDRPIRGGRRPAVRAAATTVALFDPFGPSGFPSLRTGTGTGWSPVGRRRRGGSRSPSTGRHRVTRTRTGGGTTWQP